MYIHMERERERERERDVLLQECIDHCGAPTSTCKRGGGYS